MKKEIIGYIDEEISVDQIFRKETYPLQKWCQWLFNAVVYTNARPLKYIKKKKILITIKEI